MGPGASPVPSPLVRRVLLFEFLVLIEYWIAPIFIGLDNYIGLWADAGYLLFAVLMGTVGVGVVYPLLPRLRVALAVPRLRWVFYGLWSAAVVLGLFATDTFRFGGPSDFAVGPSLQLLWDPVSTPFGPFPTLTFGYVPLRLIGALNVEVLSVLGVLSMLWASAVVLGMARPAARCEVPTAAASPKTRAAALLMWGPLGFMTGCSACTPIYIAALGVIAPGAALGAYNSIPLVPWIGLAGLLYLASLAITLRLLGRATTGAPEVAPSSNAPFALAEGTA